MNEDIYLSLGSNMGQPLENLLQALELLKRKGLELIDLSGIYVTEPVGFLEQADFFNMVVKVHTDKEPAEVLQICQEIEEALGRVRELRWGPRTIDLDILLYGERTMAEEDLQIPHPRLGERAFCLIPLQEISPYLVEKNIPQQKVVLLVTKEDVKMRLEERFLLGKG